MKGGNLLKDTQKFVSNSLSFLDIMWVRVIIIILLILYIAGGIPMLTMDVASIFHNPIVKLGFLLLILYVGFKDIPIALLLALAFVLSLQIGYKYQLGAQLGASPSGVEVDARAAVNEGGVEIKAKIGEVDGVEAMMGDREGDGPDGGNYNHYFDCVKDCAENDVGKGALDSPCTGVGVWKKELNAQGLNCPLGYSGMKDGAPF